MLNKYLFLSFLYAILSSLRITFLPELQLLIILILLIVHGKINLSVFLIIVITLCTHHYVIPDANFRFKSEFYPSIYTRSYYGLKLLDVLTILAFVFSLRFLKNIKFILNKNLPFILMPLSLLGFLHLKLDTLAFDVLLFNLRSYLLIISFFLISMQFSKTQFVLLSKIVIFSWTFKMFFSILITHEYPLYRELLGFKGIVFFAGDEYLTIGIYLILILLLSNKNEIKFSKLFLVVNFIFLLTLIAQRKGGVPYFLILNTILILIYFVRYDFVHKFFNFIIIFEIFGSFLFLYFLYPYVPEIIQLGFLDYKNLSSSAVDSFLNLDLYNKIFGITPFGKYEIINLPTVFDSEFAFGNEVSEKFRYKIWTIPMERMILNVGIIGYIYFIIYIIKSAYQENILNFYLICSFLGFFYFALITPVSAVAIGISLAAFIKNKKSLRYKLLTNFNS
jgi:hypothetical protein